MKNKRLAGYFGTILSEVRHLRRLSQEELAHRSDLDRTYISQLERGKKMPTLQTLYSLSTSLMISPVEILAKISRLQSLDEANEGPQQSSAPKLLEESENVALPFYATSVSCGQPIGHDHEVEKVLSLDELLIKTPDKTFFIQASGDSMAPAIIDRDYLVVDSSSGPVKNGQVIIAQLNGEFTVKRYFEHDGAVTLKSDNPIYADILVTGEVAFYLCGLIVGVIRLNI